MHDSAIEVRGVLEHMREREAQIVALFAVDVSMPEGATEPLLTLHVAPAVPLSRELSEEWHTKLNEMVGLLRRAYEAGEFKPRA